MSNFNEKRQQSNYGIFVYLMVVWYLMRAGYVFLTDNPLFGLIFVFIGCMAAIGMCYLRSKSYRQSFLQNSILFWILIVVQIFMSVLMTVNEEYNWNASQYFKTVLTLLTSWGVYVILKQCNAKARRVILWIYFVGIIASAGYTLFVCMTGPEDVIRMTAAGEFVDIFPFRYGGFDFIYCLVIIYVALFCFVRKCGAVLKVWKKLIIYLVLLLMAFTIIASDYSTAFVLILVVTCMYLFKNIYLRIAFVLSVFCILRFMPELIVTILDNIPFLQDLTKDRLSDMVLSLAGLTNTVSNDYEGRWNRILASLQIFEENPILGGYAGNTKLAFGNHTEWIDLLAKYGVITFCSIVGFWISTFKNIVKTENDRVQKSIIKITFVSFLVLGFLNPISLDVTVIPLFAFVPFLSTIFDIRVSKEIVECNEN